VSERGVSADPINELVDAVERRSYAAEGTASGDLSPALQSVLSQLEAGVDVPRRIRALLLPLSLSRVGERRREPALPRN